MLNIIFIFDFLIKMHYSSLFIPNKYCIDEAQKECDKILNIYVNSLYSSKEIIKIEYSDSGFCSVNKTNQLSNNIGQNAMYDQLFLSNYQLPFNQNKECVEVCKLDHPEAQIKKMVFAIEQTFQHEWVADGLPILRCITDDGEKACFIHFYIGCDNKNTLNYGSCDSKYTNHKFEYIVFNHLDFEVIWHTTKDGTAEIVEILVTPESFKDCKTKTEAVGFSAADKSFPVSFTYSVKYTKNDNLEYKNRFDYIYHINDPGHVKWVSITISIFLVIILTVVCAHLFIRAVRSDISRYTEMINTGFESQDEYGWKLLKGDIFRAPKYRLLLSVTVGNGVQILFMTLFTLIFAIFGFFSPLARGSLITCLIIMYVLLGIVSGFVSARIYKFFDGERWKLCVLASALLHSGIIFSALLTINLDIKIFSSGLSIPFMTLFELFALWTFISIPLTFAGALYGFKRRAIKSPVKKNIIPRMIPRQVFYTKPLFAILFGSFLCFLCIYVKLHFIFQSIWLRHSYVMLSLLFFITILMVIFCAEVSVVACYFHLCAEDYRWQWRSFLTVACCSIYCLISYMYEFSTTLEMSHLGKFVSLTYTSIILYMLSLATGSVGFLSCFYVLLKMFSLIKVD